MNKKMFFFCHKSIHVYFGSEEKGRRQYCHNVALYTYHLLNSGLRCFSVINR